MESGIVLWVAPEGTRAKDGKLALFKKGAFITAIQAKALIKKLTLPLKKLVGESTPST